MNIGILDDNRSISFSIVEEIELEFPSVEISVFSSIKEYNNYNEENNKKWDILIIDYNLNDEKMDGIDFIKILLKGEYNGKIIIITGEGGLMLKMKILMLDNNIEYIEKNDKMMKNIIDFIENNYE